MGGGQPMTDKPKKSSVDATVTSSTMADDFGYRILPTTHSSRPTPSSATQQAEKQVLLLKKRCVPVKSPLQALRGGAHGGAHLHHARLRKRRSSVGEARTSVPVTSAMPVRVMLWRIRFSTQKNPPVASAPWAPPSPWDITPRF